MVSCNHSDKDVPKLRCGHLLPCPWHMVTIDTAPIPPTISKGVDRMVKEGTRFLAVCQCGHSRSVALTRVLHARGHEAVAVGWQTSGSAFFFNLCYTADRILIVDDNFLEKIPLAFRDKVTSMHVGNDRWANPFNPELIKLMETHCDAKGW